MILLSAEIIGRKQSLGFSWYETIFADGNLRRKQDITSNVGGRQNVTNSIGRKQKWQISLYRQGKNPKLAQLTLLHSEWPKLNRVLAVQSAIGLNKLWRRKTCLFLISYQNLTNLNTVQFL